MNNLHTPDGVKDIYGDDYSRKLEAENRIHDIFLSYGYSDIQTPTLEYYDVFRSGIGTTPGKDLYRFTERDGQTVVLRPDFTPSIARCAAKYFLEENKSLRLTYKGNAFSQTSDLQGKLKETTQMGIEVIGDDGVEADAEVITLAVEALKITGLSDFKITISNIEYFKGLCEELGLSENVEYTLRDYVTNKNFFGAKDYLDNLGIDESIVSQIMKFDELIGGISILDDACSLVTNEKSLEAIERLKNLYDILDSKGFAKYISFDLSMLNKYQYYTGMVFKAYAYGVGDCVAKGGRYDNLLSTFGADAPAVGFVIQIDDLMLAYKNANRSDNEYLTIALTKGRLADKTLSLLESIGITCDEMKDKDTRKLIFVNDDLKLRFFLAKGPDVPTYVENGVADIGVVGKDTITEENRRVYEVLDLGFGKCRMCVCGPAKAKELLKHHELIRVCTKYPNMAKDYFYNKKAQTVELIKLNGSVELGPIVGLGDVIVDIVETGSTLRENGLEVLEEICPLSCRMIVNQVSMQMQSDRIKDLIAKLREQLD
ncbi:MAG: ATP phosphoribosyltransferase regulatory subunit [Lachnospiraceae bacterium]|nr:ATP phosphoribosyltransferase regulatory subunit [Candidatus Colinaster equi]